MPLDGKIAEQSSLIRKSICVGDPTRRDLDRGGMARETDSQIIHDAGRALVGASTRRVRSRGQKVQRRQNAVNECFNFSHGFRRESRMISVVHNEGLNAVQIYTDTKGADLLIAALKELKERRPSPFTCNGRRHSSLSSQSPYRDGRSLPS